VERFNPADVLFGTEFVSHDLDLLAYQRGVTLDLSRPGQTTDNASIEAFNSRFRAECLLAHWFFSLQMPNWRKYFNQERPHGAIGNNLDHAAESGPRRARVSDLFTMAGWLRDRPKIDLERVVSSQPFAYLGPRQSSGSVFLFVVSPI
jgi:transposase InsO family protein